ncbi:uncharacterized protein PRCAT00002447001 [Priceomyces carsonii]|uniref:uncharacterized protein n=1 Tax=Priceomyces carsonii TaxID=28549 RepID=UPI002ED7D5AF|nr:unnamed protein product [Priceomyces carsonii]
MMIRTISRSQTTIGRWFSSGRILAKHQGNLKLEDTTVDADEIISENNPWSPTLYNDIVSIRPPGSFRSKELPLKYRLSYLPLYEAPGAKYVALLRRITLSFAVIGVYGAKLFFDSAQFDDLYALGSIIGTSAPAAFVQYKTRNYVTRIFRLYNKEKPQTLKNLIDDEKVIMEKLNFTGGKTYNQLLTITGNKTVKISPKPTFPSLAPLASWQDIDPETNIKLSFYIVDDIGGIKMDRLWGIVEHNSGLNNGRYMELDIPKD